MIYKTVEKPLDETLELLKKTFEGNNIHILSIEEKQSENISNIKLVVITAEINKKPFRVSLIQEKEKTILSVVFPKKLFTDKEQKSISKSIQNL